MSRLSTAALAIAISLAPGLASAATFEVLYSFPMRDAAGNWLWAPLAGVSVTPQGHLLGTLGVVGMTGGVDNVGMVYRLTPSGRSGVPWTFDLVHEFSTSESSPQSELTRTRDGTYVGGTSYYYKNFGETFEIKPSAGVASGWDLAVTHRFAANDHMGAGPTGGLVEAADGKFYGTSEGYFYTSGYGGVFRLGRPDPCSETWKFESLFEFPWDHSLGGSPSARPIIDARGVIYATEKDKGTVFSLTPPKTVGGVWTYAQVYDLSGSGLDSGLIGDGSGGFFGVASSRGAYGKGYVFHLVRPTRAGGKWTMAKIHSFTGGWDGSAPKGELIRDQDGALYGVTSDGNPPYSGTVFKLTPPAATGGRWKAATLHRFTSGRGGADPIGRLARGSSGWIYGVTNGGGATNRGIVYRLKP